MQVTATEFKTNIGKYLTIVADHDIFITKNGKSVARLTSAKMSKIDTAKSLFGIIPNDGTTLEQSREERLTRYEAND